MTSYRPTLSQPLSPELLDMAELLDMTEMTPPSLKSLAYFMAGVFDECEYNFVLLPGFSPCRLSGPGGVTSYLTAMFDVQAQDPITFHELLLQATLRLAPSDGHFRVQPILELEYAAGRTLYTSLKECPQWLSPPQMARPLEDIRRALINHGSKPLVPPEAPA